MKKALPPAVLFYFKSSKSSEDTLKKVHNATMSCSDGSN